MKEKNPNIVVKGGKNTPKLNQNFNVIQYDDIQFVAGTVDRSTYKGCYLEVKGHFTSKGEDHTKSIKKLLKDIRFTVERAMDKTFFFDKFLMCDEVSNSFSSSGTSFTRLEFTFFPKNKTNKDELTNKLNEICNGIHQEIIVDNKYIEFNKSIIRA